MMDQILNSVEKSVMRATSSPPLLDEIVVFGHDVSDHYFHGFVSNFYDVNATRKILYGT